MPATACFCLSAYPPACLPACYCLPAYSPACLLLPATACLPLTARLPRMTDHLLLPAGVDYLCVQSYDGQLSFFECETLAFSRFLPNYLLPGPLCYCQQSDSFITCNAAFELECYKYKVLAAASGEKQTGRGGAGGGWWAGRDCGLDGACACVCVCVVRCLGVWAGGLACGCMWYCAWVCGMGGRLVDSWALSPELWALCPEP